MYNFYFDRVTRKTVLAIVLAFALLIFAAISLSGCKTRQMQKEKSEKIDQSQSNSHVNVKDTVADSSSKSSNTNVKTEVNKDEATGTETTTKTTYFEPSEKIPPCSPKETTTTTKTTGKSKENSKSEQTNKIDEFANHSQIKDLDSTSNKKNDIKASGETKKVDAKGKAGFNWLVWGLIAGFILSVFIWWKFIR